MRNESAVAANLHCQDCMALLKAHGWSDHSDFSMYLAMLSMHIMCLFPVIFSIRLDISYRSSPSIGQTTNDDIGIRIVAAVN